MAKIRADQLVVDRGLAESRSKAQALILAGLVFSGERKIEKAGQALAEDAALEVRGREHPWVSRGGIKLAHEDTGEAVKYLIGNKDYFAHVVGLPEARDALARVPGAGAFLRLVGVEPPTGIPAENPDSAN